VPADERLRAASRGDLSRLGQLEIEMESQLRPREIQARIRAGASVEQVAAEASTDPSRIERYAYPVLLERSTIADRGQLAHPMVGGVPARKRLGDLVSAVLVERGQQTGVAWDAYKDETGWVLVLRWRAGRSENRAHWSYHPGPDSGTVTANDDAAAALMDPAPRPLRTVPVQAPTQEVFRPAATTAAPAPAASDSAAARPDEVDADPPTQEIPAVPADHISPDTETDPVPTDRFAGRVEDAPADEVEVVEQTVLDDRSGAAGVAAADSEHAARTGTDSAIGSRSSGSAGRKRSGGKQRPVMPSWEDVLLGGKGRQR
jgi:Protein of unknown function (DUF3071)